MEQGKNKKYINGFSMLEAIIAVFICAAVFTTLISILAPVIGAEFYQKDRILAANLAQEGVEIVRNIRDNNLRSLDPDGNPKLAFAIPFPPVSSGGYCVNFDVNYSSTRPPAVGPAGCEVKMHYNTSEMKIFRRRIEVGGSGSRRIITSTVTWRPTGKDEDAQVVVSDTLWAWGENE